MNNRLPQTPWRVIACDLDGTLLGPDQRINPEDLAALRRARDAGLHVAICTGRNSHESAVATEALLPRGPGVFANGAIVCEMSTGQSLQRMCMTPELVNRLVDFLGGRGHAVTLLADDAHTPPRYMLTDHAPPHESTRQWLELHRSEVTVVHAVTPENACQIVRLGIVVDSDQKPAIMEALAEHFENTTHFHSIYSPWRDSHVIEVFRSGVTKWSGIEAMCRLLEVDPSRVVVIGDDVNDLPMLRQAALSFAMGNASAEIQSQAKRVTATQADRGVAAVVEGILSGKW